MRAVIFAVVVLSLGGCSAQGPIAAPVPPPAVHQQAVRQQAAEGPSLTCGAKGGVRTGYLPRGLRSRSRLLRVRLLGRVRGYRWRTDSGEWIAIALRCDVPGPRRLLTLVPRATLTMRRGRPAIRWTRHHSSFFLWLDRPGVAVLVAASRGLRHEMPHVMSGIRGNLPSR